MEPSEEASLRQIQIAQRQGNALRAAVDAMDEESGSGVLTRRAGDYEIDIAVEEAEGMWCRVGDELTWRNPGEDENCHVEVCIRDRGDGRFVPALDVCVTLVDEDGVELGPHAQPFVWHPWLYHYGRNWRVEHGGEYRVRVRIEPPEFLRHDHENGRRYRDAVEVEFEHVPVEPGRKTAP